MFIAVFLDWYKGHLFLILKMDSPNSDSRTISYPIFILKVVENVDDYAILNGLQNLSIIFTQNS